LRNRGRPDGGTPGLPTNPQLLPSGPATSEGQEITQFRVSPQEKIGPVVRKIDL